MAQAKGEGTGVLVDWGVAEAGQVAEPDRLCV